VSEPVAPPAWLPADPAALRNAVERAGGGGEPPGPGFAEYAFDLGRWLQSLFVALLERALPDAIDEELQLLVVYAAALVALSALAVVLVMVARRVRRRRRRGEEAAAEELVGAAAGLPATAREAEWWWSEAARRLAAGELRPALAALWWWAARRLDPPGLDESWTTGELLRRSGAAALRPPLRRLDTLLWGAELPRAEQVEELRAELRRRVESSSGAAA
jgi:hypothetical protein